MAEIIALEIYPSIKNYIDALKKHFEIESVFLFGSYATGLASNDSYIDLALSEADEGQIPRLLRRINKICFQKPRRPACQSKAAGRLRRGDSLIT